MLLINLDDNRNGVAVIDGIAYRVTGTYSANPRTIWPETAGRRKWSIDLVLGDTLDEEQQRKRIERLERELQDERDKLEEIRRMASGEPEPEDRHA